MKITHETYTWVRLWLIKVSDHSNSVKGKVSDAKVIQTESEPDRGEHL